jgi:acyl carrier protein
MEEKLKDFINLIITERSEGEDKTNIEELRSNILLRDDLQFSSLELATLTVLIEDEYGVDVFEDGIVTTVGELLSLIEAGE